MEINTNEKVILVLFLRYDNFYRTPQSKNYLSKSLYCICSCTKFKIIIWGRKTYRLNFRTIKKRCSYGVVAKPGIATGSRSN